MHILFVKFHSGLEHDEVVANLEKRLPLFRAVRGLIQKYYARETATGDYVGVYLFESEEALRDYRASDVARSIPRRLPGPGRAADREVRAAVRDERRKVTLLRAAAAGLRRTDR